MQEDFMWQENLIFPRVPRTFWRQFRRHWAEPLRLLEEVISLSESLGADPSSERFEVMDGNYWLAIRSLHARACLHARSVLALLSLGLVDPAWVQWRSCHESSTLARFIAANPETAPRYTQFSLLNKYRLAAELHKSNHQEAPSKAELNELQKIADDVRSDLNRDNGRKPSQNEYAWSGFDSFKKIEDAVFRGRAWNPRAEYIFASERVHSAPNASEPHQLDDDSPVFVVGPTNSGLTGPADLTSLSIVLATEALLLNAALAAEDQSAFEELSLKHQLVGAMFWALDPEILCPNCGGYEKGSSPPDILPVDERPQPCSCSIEIADY